MCIYCEDQVILYTIFFVTRDFIVAFVFYIWRYFNGTHRRGSFEARSAAVDQLSGGAARRIASEALVGRRAGRGTGQHPGADGRFSLRWKGRPRGGAGPSGNRGVGAPDGGRNAGPGRRVRSGAGLLSGSAPRTGVADPGSRVPGFREAKPFGAASFGVGAATGWRADRRSEAWLLSGTALPARRTAPLAARRRPVVARILFAGDARDAGLRFRGRKERVITRPAGLSRGLPKTD